MITSERSADILNIATNFKKVSRYDFENSFSKEARNVTDFHNNTMRCVRLLAEKGLLTRKNRGVYSISREGRNALKAYNKRAWQ